MLFSLSKCASELLIYQVLYEVIRAADRCQLEIEFLARFRRKMGVALMIGNADGNAFGVDFIIMMIIVQQNLKAGA
ncbi:hypothetical protein D3C73_1504580 [compost metagenome]